MPLISQAVGPRQANIAGDVMLVQGLLRQDIFDRILYCGPDVPVPPDITGVFDGVTANALEMLFQRVYGRTRPISSLVSMSVETGSPIMGYSPGVKACVSPGGSGRYLAPASSAAWIEIARFMRLPPGRYNGLVLSESDFVAAATTLGCEVASVKAVAEVESSSSGWLADGRPKILFEAHKFSKYTSPPHSLDKILPDISSRKWNKKLYKGGAAEYDRLEKAMAFDRKAALKSASYGRFQIMGFNHENCGYRAVEDFVEAMFSGESRQLEAFVRLLISSDLAKPLRDKNWAAFALGYNGSGYAENQYDVKMERAYSRYSKKSG